MDFALSIKVSCDSDVNRPQPNEPMFTYESSINDPNMVPIDPTVDINNGKLCFAEAMKYQSMGDITAARMSVQRALCVFLNIYGPINNRSKCGDLNILSMIIDAYLCAATIEINDKSFSNAHVFYESALSMSQHSGNRLQQQNIIRYIISNCYRFNPCLIDEFNAKLINIIDTNNTAAAAPSVAPIFDCLVATATTTTTTTTATVANAVPPTLTPIAAGHPSTAAFFPLPFTPAECSVKSEWNVNPSQTVSNFNPNLTHFPSLLDTTPIECSNNLSFPPMLNNCSSSSSSAAITDNTPMHLTNERSNDSGATVISATAATSAAVAPPITNQTNADDIDSEAEKAKPFECRICHRRYVRKASLKSHERIHSDGAPQCDICGMKFSSALRLKIHKQRHLGIKPFVCKQCGGKFSDKGNLTRHMRKHSGVKPYLCDFCPVAFTDKTALIDHTRRRHTGEKPFHCPQCDKAFISSSDMKNHQKSHSDDRPFECSHCHKRFKRKSDCAKHTAAFHQ